MWWYLFQGLIVFAVVSSNIAWQWTPNRMLPALIGAGLAYGATAAISGLARAIRAWLKMA